jgi:hypothetical protein
MTIFEEEAGSRMVGRTRFTREVLEAIPVWLEMGAGVADIAAALNTTEGSLRVTCCRYKISLRTTGAALRSELPVEHWRAVQREAARRGVPTWQLVADVLSRVAEGGMFSEILGDSRRPS